MKTIQELRELSVAERIQLVEDLWDSIAEDARELPLSEAQRQELDRRLDDLEKNPTAGKPWEQVKREIADRL